MDIIEPASWPQVRDGLPKVNFLWEYLIPAGGTKTLLHGPPGCGKSALAWGVLNAVAAGERYLGLDTSQSKALLISNDMNLFEFKHRWGGDFEPRFAFVCTPKFDCTKDDFQTCDFAKSISTYLREKQIGFVVFDALGGIHAGRSAKDDEVATMVDHALSKWLGDVAILLIAHDRKTRYGSDGNPQEPSQDDFMGSQMWRANATSQVHLWATGKHSSILVHDKSQVSEKLERKIKLYIDLHGRAETWNEARANEVVRKYNDAVRTLGLSGLPETERVARVAIHCGVSERTVWRWKTLVE